jgi:hypothetical protein
MEKTKIFGSYLCLEARPRPSSPIFHRRPRRVGLGVITGWQFFLIRVVIFRHFFFFCCEKEKEKEKEKKEKEIKMIR